MWHVDIRSPKADPGRDHMPTNRVINASAAPDSGLMYLYRVRPEADVKQHMRRRRKRKREKAAKQAEVDALVDAHMPQIAEESEAAIRSSMDASTSGADVEATDEIAPWQVSSKSSSLGQLEDTSDMQLVGQCCFCNPSMDTHTYIYNHTYLAAACHECLLALQPTI